MLDVDEMMMKKKKREEMLLLVILLALALVTPRAGAEECSFGHGVVDISNDGKFIVTVDSLRNALVGGDVLTKVVGGGVLTSSVDAILVRVFPYPPSTEFSCGMRSFVDKP